MPTPAGPIDVVDVLHDERARFVELLRTLEPEEWRRPTECPAYDVQGVAAHVLGDDLSLLSRQRDGAESGVVRFLADAPSFPVALDRFNDSWVDTARFFGTPLLIDLLEVTGRWTADWYAAVDPSAPGEPVLFFGLTDTSPWWHAAAREYVERWTHHHQIRRATGRDDVDDARLIAVAAAVAVRGIAGHLRDGGAEAGDRVGLAVGGVGVWTLERSAEGWSLLDGEAEDARATLRLEPAAVVRALSRGLTANDAAAAWSAEGDATLGAALLKGVARLTAGLVRPG